MMLHCSTVETKTLASAAIPACRGVHCTSGSPVILTDYVWWAKRYITSSYSDFRTSLFWQNTSFDTPAQAAPCLWQDSDFLPSRADDSLTAMAEQFATHSEPSAALSRTVATPAETSTALSPTVAIPADTSTALSPTVATPAETSVALSPTVATTAEPSTALSSTVATHNEPSHRLAGKLAVISVETRHTVSLPV
ncbi:MAG: hypothetical protein LBR08_12685 [Bacteroidales bacterium]|nr:hypothetical protein [Bacteroidales bacterium]